MGVVPTEILGLDHPFRLRRVRWNFLLVDREREAEPFRPCCHRRVRLPHRHSDFPCCAYQGAVEDS